MDNRVVVERIDPALLPAVADARLPAVYQSAQQALAECERIDECRDWADKAAALASYAKQADDESLFQTAVRIKARAIKRCGEMLKDMQPAATGGAGGGAPTDDDRPGRIAAAKAAGMSKDQAIQAIRVANVPADEFEALVESDSPPTVTQLAEIGKKPKPATEKLIHVRQKDEAIRLLAGAADALVGMSPALVRRAASAEERALLMRARERLVMWLDELADEIETDEIRTSLKK